MPKLKCWKKLRDDNEYLLYHFHVVPRGAEVKIAREYIPKTKIPMYWEVTIWETDKLKPSTEKPFETKKEATSFAQKYMRNHDRC